MGNSESFGPSISNIWLIKLDSNGNVEWEKTYAGGETDIAESRSAEQTTDGGYIISGTIGDEEVAGSRDAWLIKVDSDGDIEWEKTYGGDETDTAVSVDQAEDGGYVFAGITVSFGGASSDIWVVKVDADGNVEWEKVYGDSLPDNSVGLPTVHQTSDGGYILGGITDSFGAGDFDTWLIKLDSDGGIEWEKTYGGTEREEEIAISVQQTSEGGYIFATGTFSFGPGDGDAWIVKLDSDGNVEWEKAYGSSDFFDNAVSVQQTSDGGFIVLGSMLDFFDPAQGDSDILLLKLDSDGNVENCFSQLKTISTDAIVEESEAEVENSNSTVQVSEAIVDDSNAVVEDSEAHIGLACPIPSVYNLTLFEGSDPSDGTVNLNQEVKAVGTTDDSDVSQVTFRWIDPAGNTVQENTVLGSSPFEDLFEPNADGTWTIEADFGNGQILIETLDISFFVLPESAIGAVALLGSSLAVLGMFYVMRMGKNRA